MQLLPNLSNVNIQTNIQSASYPTTTYFLDKESMQLRSYVDGIEAMTQVVEICLNVERFQWQIYTKNFGIELNGLIGEDYGFVASELKRRITEALMVDDRIKDVTNFEFELNETMEELTASFFVSTVFGDLEYSFTMPGGDGS